LDQIAAHQIEEVVGKLAQLLNPQESAVSVTDVLTSVRPSISPTSSVGSGSILLKNSPVETVKAH
jgi:hypothetical protein